MRHHILETSKGEIHYWVEGKGKECLFFTHGMTLTHQIFLPQTVYFQEEFTVILWDVPLHGKSRNYKEYNQTECTQLMETILEREGFQSAHIIGESMGGYIAQQFAAEHPQKTQSLSIVGGHPLGTRYYWMIEQLIFKNLHRAVKSVPYSFIIGITVAFSGIQEVGKETTRVCMLNHSKKQIQKITKSVYRDFLSYEKELTIDASIPVGVFYGKWDMVGRLKYITKKWAKEKGYPVYVIPKAAHNVNIDNPFGFNEAFKQFLQEEKTVFAEEAFAISF